MAFYNLDLDGLSAYTGISVAKLKAKSYAKLESMIHDMHQAKFMEQNKQNAEDREYERLVLSYFEPVGLLRHWFDDREIVLACANTGTGIRDLCSEHFVEPGQNRNYWESHGEYLRTSREYVPQYDGNGRQLMESKKQMMDVYRVRNEHQSLYQGQVIRHLLYGRYPELEKYNFKFYGLAIGEKDYEIYPDNNVYVSLTALLSGDVDWIMFRNRSYCREYDNGLYTLKECEKRFRTKEVLEMFDLISRIGEQEKAAGHSPVRMDENGRLITANSFEETRVLQADIRMLHHTSWYPQAFKLECSGSVHVKDLIDAFLLTAGTLKVSVSVCHITDHLGEHGLHFGDIVEDKSYAGTCGEYTVHSAFGQSFDDAYYLMIRVDCPELMTSR